jgi:hypothetical protein
MDVTRNVETRDKNSGERSVDDQLAECRREFESEFSPQMTALNWARNSDSTDYAHPQIQSLWMIWQMAWMQGWIFAQRGVNADLRERLGSMRMELAEASNLPNAAVDSN